MALGDKDKATESKASTYKRINKAEFEDCLAKTDLQFQTVDYDWTGELIYEAYSKDETFTIRVYSSLSKHSGAARDKGSDAIRVVLLHTESGQPLMKNKRVHRIQTFCKNLRQRIRKVVDSKGNLQYCPICDGLMVIRTNKKNNNKFYGCLNYPDCTGTRSING